MTWSGRFDAHLGPVARRGLALHQAAWDQKVGGDLRDLQRFGLFDAARRWRGFAYAPEEPLDQTLKALTIEYGHVLHGAYDYRGLRGASTSPST